MFSNTEVNFRSHYLLSHNGKRCELGNMSNYVLRNVMVKSDSNYLVNTTFKMSVLFLYLMLSLFAIFT